SQIETFFYSIDAPSKGGPALVRLPSVGVRGAAAGELRRMSRDRPPTVRPVMHPRLAGEGVWHATQARFAGLAVPPLLVTTYRPDPSYPPVVAGLAWVNPPRGALSARQNLPLIVDHGRPNPNLDNGPAWGVAVGGSVMVWRSGLGVDRRGNLIYAAAPDQTVRGLARILIHGGAVRAMELDINS